MRCALNKKHPREYLKTNIMADTMVLTDEGCASRRRDGISQVVMARDNPSTGPCPSR
jgi:hypothetical protein